MNWNNYCTNNHWYWFWPFGIFIFIAIFFILSRFLWWGSRYRKHGYWQGYGHGGGDPLHIAKARYAAGKITKEEFYTIKKELDK
jgi:uncharacterized membrane protein